MWNIGCNLTVAFLVSFILFYKALRGMLGKTDIALPHALPLLLLLYMLYVFLVSFFQPKPAT